MSGEGGPFRPLSAAARRVAAASGVRLAVFARPGDRLWLPGPLPKGVALPAGIEVESGPLGDLAPVVETLAWGEDGRVAALRRRAPRGRPAPQAQDVAPDPLALPLRESVWRLPVPEPGVVARVAHRRFAFDLARARGWALPGTGFAADVAGVERLARAVGPVSGGPWVAKAPFSAAGRERFFASGPGDLRAREARRRLEGLLAKHGSLLVEPWVERVADFGSAGRVTGAGARVDTVHGLEVDRRGAFRGIVPLPGDFLHLPSPERDLLESAFYAAADALATAGYSGPFGIDAFRWLPEGDRGRAALQPLVEINPRLTFGLVAHAEGAEGETAESL